MSNSSVIDQISRIRFTVKGIKWHPLFLAKLTGFIYRKKDAEAKKAFLIGKIAGAKYSGSKELIKAEKILSDTTKNASILVTHTRQLADCIDAESEQVQTDFCQSECRTDGSRNNCFCCKYLRSIPEKPAFWNDPQCIYQSGRL